MRGQRRDVAVDVALRVDLLEALGAALVLDLIPRAGRAVRRAAARERFAGLVGREILEADDALAVFVEFVRHVGFALSLSALRRLVLGARYAAQSFGRA